VKKLAALLLLVLTVGCATQHGVPNYVRVNPHLSRGGQPDAIGWDTIKASGVDTVIKLNTGRDAYAEQIGLRVIYLPISTWEQTLGTPDSNTLARAVFEIEEAIREGRCVFVHCTHGQDRTGLIIGLYLYHNGMSKDEVYKQMKALGFHPSLLGLYSAWEKARSEDLGKNLGDNHQ